MPFDVRMPDGTLLRNVPDGTTQEDILDRYNASQQPTAPVQQPVQNRSLPEQVARQVGLTGRAVYEAFTSPATAVLEAGRTAYNLGAEAVGSQSRLPSFYTEQSKSLTAAGVPEPENAIERAVNLGTQAMVSTGAAAKALPKVAAFSSDLVRQVPASGVAGLVSQPVAEIVKDITGSDLAAIIASAGAGALGAAGTGKAISAAQQAKNPLYTMAEIKQRASKAYNTMDEAGVVLKPESTTKMLTEVKQSLDDARMIPGTAQAQELNARIAAILARFNMTIGGGSGPTDTGGGGSLIYDTALSTARATNNKIQEFLDKFNMTTGGNLSSNITNGSIGSSFRYDPLSGMRATAQDIRITVDTAQSGDKFAQLIAESIQVAGRSGYNTSANGSLPV